MKKIFLIIVVVLLYSCNQKKSQAVVESPLPKDFKYEIISLDKFVANDKANVKVSINQKVDDQILRYVAPLIKAEAGGFSKTYIGYYLNGDLTSYPYAVTNFTPLLTVEIMGSTNDLDLKIRDTTNIEGEILGKWICDKSLQGGSLLIFKDVKGNPWIRTAFKDGNYLYDEIKIKKFNGKIKYTYNNSHGEYYILEDNGNLGLYGNNGKFDEAIKF